MPNYTWTGPTTTVSIEGTVVSQDTTAYSTYAGSCGPDCPLCNPGLRQTNNAAQMTAPSNNVGTVIPANIAVGGVLTQAIIEDAALRAASEGGRPDYRGFYSGYPSYTISAYDTITPTTGQFEYEAVNPVGFMENILKGCRDA